MKLTNAKLRSLSVGKKVSDGGGLYYRSTAHNKGKWGYRFTMDGKSYEMGLETFSEIGKWIANKQEQRGFQKALVKLKAMNENTW